MTALPPAGWFPDPDAGGTRWRWWDGRQWAPPGYGYQTAYDAAWFAYAREARARTTHSTAKWLRWAMAANGVYFFVAVVGIAVAFHRGVHYPTTNPDGSPHFDGTFFAVQLLAIPLGFISWAFTGLFIAWLYHAGKFADLQPWPAVRSRTLGAFSVLIPFVNLWWPYEAIRDLYPPGARPDVALHWWLTYLLVPIGAFVTVFVVTLNAPVAVTAVVVMVAGAVLTIPVALGWRLLDDLDAMQRRYLAPA